MVTRCGECCFVSPPSLCRANGILHGHLPLFEEKANGANTLVNPGKLHRFDTTIASATHGLDGSAHVPSKPPYFRNWRREGRKQSDG